MTTSHLFMSNKEIKRQKMAAKVAAALAQQEQGQPPTSASKRRGSGVFHLDKSVLFAGVVAIFAIFYLGYSSYYTSTHVNVEPVESKVVEPQRATRDDITLERGNVTFAEPPDQLFKSADWDDVDFMKKYKCNVKHQYSLSILNKSPLMMYITGFLQPGEADHLKFIAHEKMERSFVYGAGGRKYAPGRTSSNAFLVRNQDKVVSCIEARASQFSGKNFRNIEELQVVHYNAGEEYKPHFDYFVPEKEGAQLELARGGQREITFFVYLNNVPDGNGGETVFPTLGFEVLPKKNDAVFWYNTDHLGKEDPKTYHSGAPIKGDWEKWGLNIWIRHGVFM